MFFFSAVPRVHSKEGGREGEREGGREGRREGFTVRPSVLVLFCHVYVFEAAFECVVHICPLLSTPTAHPVFSVRADYSSLQWRDSSSVLANHEFFFGAQSMICSSGCFFSCVYFLVHARTNSRFWFCLQRDFFCTTRKSELAAAAAAAAATAAAAAATAAAAAVAAAAAADLVGRQPCAL